MKKTTIFNYYAFGHNYQLIKQNGLGGSSNKDAKHVLQIFFNKLDELNLPVTSRVSEKLESIMDELPNNDNLISKDHVDRINDEIIKIDPSLDAELELKEAFVLTEKRFSLDSLTSKPEKLLGKDVFLNLSDNSKKDFSLACMQVALSQPTAAAFHLMRSVEEQIKNLYFEFKKKNRLEKPMWGPIIQELRSKRNPKPSSKTLDTLDSIRVHFRNPTQHPEAFYTLDEAQDLLNQTITAINMINREIRNK